MAGRYFEAVCITVFTGLLEQKRHGSIVVLYRRGVIDVVAIIGIWM